MRSMKKTRERNSIKELVAICGVVCLVGAIASGIILDGHEPDASGERSYSYAGYSFVFDVNKLPVDLLRHAEKCAQKGMGAGRVTGSDGKVVAIKCYEK
jgi:hypothetical protein